MRNNALIYYSDRDFGGAERRLTRIYNELGQRNKCDIIVRGCTKEEFILRLEKADCKVDTINNIVCFDSNFNCIMYILKQKYDVIHFFDPSSFNTCLSLLMHLLKRKTVLTIASVPVSEKITSGNIKLIDKVLIRYSTVVDMLYPWAKDATNRYRRNCDVQITCGTFTDLERFKPQHKEKILVYAAARLEMLKNPMLLVEACNISKNVLRDSGYKVFLLGKGELEEQLRASISNHGIEDLVFMPGYKKTSDIFPKAAAVFSLQQNENYPSQVIAEACASGCYLFITDVGTSRKCASNSFTAFVKSSPDELAKAIKDYVTTNDTQKNNFVKQSRDFAEKNYSIKKSAEYYQNLIQKAQNVKGK